MDGSRSSFTASVTTRLQRLQNENQISQIFLFMLDPGSPFRIHNHMRHWPRSYAYVFLFVFVYIMIIILMVPSVEKTNMRHWPRRYASICSPLLLQALSCHMEQIMPSTLRKLKSVVGSYKNKIWLHSFTIGYKVAFIFRYVLDALASGTSLYILFLSSGFWDRNPNINTEIILDY